MKIITLSEETEHYMDVIRKQMESLGVLEEADIQNLDLMASQVELYVRAMREIDRNGLTCIDAKGRQAANPAFAVARSSMQSITSLMKELSISCRQRRLLTKDAMVTEEDPMDIFLAEMKDND